MTTTLNALFRNAVFVFAVSAALACLHGCAGHAPLKSEAGANQAQPTIVREDKAFDLGKSIAKVEIENRYGEINVRDHDEAEVGVHAVGQLLPGKWAEARLVSRRERDTLKLSVVLPEGATDARYDMAVFVSKDMPLVLHGGRFRVDARKRNASLAITTVSGKINASSHAALDLASESGTIQAAQLEPDWFGTSHLRSKSGQIVALAPLSGNVSLSAETGGNLRTNFGLSVHPRPQGGQQASAQYGNGSSQWRIESDSGEIILEQVVILGEDTDSAEDSD